MIDCALQQKDSTDYPITTVAIDNGPPRQQHIGVIYLSVAQFVSTSKQVTREDTECAS